MRHLRGHGIFHTRQNAEFSFNSDITLMSIIHHLLRELNVFLERVVGSIYHH